MKNLTLLILAGILGLSAEKLGGAQLDPGPPAEKLGEAQLDPARLRLAFQQSRLRLAFQQAVRHHPVRRVPRGTAPSPIGVPGPRLPPGDNDDPICVADPTDFRCPR